MYYAVWGAQELWGENLVYVSHTDLIIITFNYYWHIGNATNATQIMTNQIHN